MSSQKPPVFYIFSKSYTPFSSGRRCLFLLCHHLNRLGYEAYVTGRNAPAHLEVRRANRKLIARNRRMGIDDIVIYPEVVRGNPLGGSKVVRYLLNRLGARGRTGPVDPSDFGVHDYIVHFADEFRHPQLASRRLMIPLVDRLVFKRNPPVGQRSGYVVYSKRFRPDLSSLPAWVSPITVVSGDNPVEPSALAALYRRSRALVVWERTAAIGEAMCCGCPVIVIPHEGFDHRELIRRTFGLGNTVGWNRRGAERALATVGLLEATYKLNRILLDRRIHGFVRDVRRHFDRLDNVPELAGVSPVVGQADG